MIVKVADAVPPLTRMALVRLRVAVRPPAETERLTLPENPLMLERVAVVLTV